VQPIRIERAVCQDYAQSSRLEWLETDGAGGFAMGTVASVNTRRYHGLLVAALRPPVDRHVLLSRLEESISSGARGQPDLELAVNQYPGVVAPQGYLRLIEFRLDPFPTWVWDVGEAHLERRLFLLPGESTVVIRWTCTRTRRLSVSPFLAFRGYHSLSHANGALDGSVVQERRSSALRLGIRPYAGLPGLSIHAPPDAAFTSNNACWYRDQEYLEELERGLDFREDVWRMGALQFEVGPEAPAFLVATLGNRTFGAAALDALEEAEIIRRRPTTPDPIAARLERAAGQFLVRRADGRPTIIAGYPWFADWGRDTFIALPGLLLSRGKLDEARDVIRAFLGHLDRGLIPNRFPDRSEERPDYNTVDATLWLFQSVHAWLQAGGDPAFVRDEVYPAGKEILRWHQQGTRHGIGVDPADGLLASGEPGAQLTWMDARVGDRVITPRHGKPVEVNALWVNALRLMAQWGRSLGDTAAAATWLEAAEKAEASFGAAFWNASKECLYDVIGQDGPDASVRPNQLFAASLAFPLLSVERRRAMVRTVGAQLLTPLGLRTLSPGDANYIARYEGTLPGRDAAYHQGTVWPWLLGPFVRAYLSAFGRSPDVLATCRAFLRPLEESLQSGCLGQLSEVFDAEAPQRPGGAPAQAWSVAELLRLISFDLAEGPGGPAAVTSSPLARR